MGGQSNMGGAATPQMGGGDLSNLFLSNQPIEAPQLPTIEMPVNPGIPMPTRPQPQRPRPRPAQVPDPVARYAGFSSPSFAQKIAAKGGRPRESVVGTVPFGINPAIFGYGGDAGGSGTGGFFQRTPRLRSGGMGAPALAAQRPQTRFPSQAQRLARSINTRAGKR